MGGSVRPPLRTMVMPVFALIAEDAVAVYIVVDRDKLGIPCGRRQNNVIVCMRFLGGVTGVPPVCFASKSI